MPQPPADDGSPGRPPHDRSRARPTAWCTRLWDSDREAIGNALRFAQQKSGVTPSLSGPEAFQAAAAHVGVDTRMRIVFEQPELETIRQVRFAELDVAAQERREAQERDVPIRAITIETHKRKRPRCHRRRFRGPAAASPRTISCPLLLSGPATARLSSSIGRWSEYPKAMLCTIGGQRAYGR
jgi:hypothetical protein